MDSNTIVPCTVEAKRSLVSVKAKGLIQDGKSLFEWQEVPKEEDGEKWEEAEDYRMGSLNISFCTGSFWSSSKLEDNCWAIKHTVIKIFKISADLITFTWLYCMFLISKQFDEVKFTLLATTSTSSTRKQNLSITFSLSASEKQNWWTIKISANCLTVKKKSSTIKNNCGSDAEDFPAVSEIS